MTSNQPHWRDYAACAQVDPELWFPEKGGQSSEARKICATCDCKRECLDAAMQEELGLARQLRATLRGGMGATARAEYEPQWLAERGAA